MTPPQTSSQRTISRPGVLRRIGWFVLLWLASVSALAVVAYAIRLAIPSG